MSKRNITKLLGKIFVLAISILLLILIISFGDLDAMYSHLRTISVVDILILIMILNVSLLLRVWRWKVLLADEVKAPFLRLVPVFLLGKAITGFTPGNVGDPLRSVILKKSEGIPVSKSIKSILVERVADLMTVIFFSLYVLLFYFQNDGIKVWIGYASLVVTIGMTLLFCFSKHFSSFILHRLARLFNKSGKIKGLIDSFIDSFCDSTIKKRTLLVALVVSVLIWTLDGFVFFYVLKSLMVGINFLYFLSAFALSVIFGLITLLPGGLGALDGGLVFLLINVGVDKNVAITGVLIGRFVTYAYPMVLGYLSFLALRVMEKKDLSNKTT